VKRVHFDQHSGLELDGTFPEGETCDVSRTRLDTLLVEAAMEAGAEVRQAFAVEDILIEHGVIVGIRGKGRAGMSAVERAEWSSAPTGTDRWWRPGLRRWGHAVVRVLHLLRRPGHQWFRDVRPRATSDRLDAHQ
jgi:hypothetical protein